VTPTPIETTTSPTDTITDWLTTYTYQVVAYQADGSYGAATIDYVPAKPLDPSGLRVSAIFANSVTISWQPVDGVWEYLVSGPGLSPSVEISATSLSVAPPGGTGEYRVASIYRPGGVLTKESTWPSVTVSTTGGAGQPGIARPGGPTGGTAPAPDGGTAKTDCACTRTGGFRNPTLRTIDEDGLTGTFRHPTAGTFTIDARSVSASVMLTVTDAMDRAVLSVDKPAGWGLSPDYRHFAVTATPQSTNTASAVVVYRVAAGPGVWPAVIDTLIDADGRWAFSAGSKMFLITRLQNAPTRFSFRAYNLEAVDPQAAVVQVGEANVSGPNVTTSPCDDRLMYFRWTQLNPLQGGADFYDRASFNPRATVIATAWDGQSQTTPTASIVTGIDGASFDVELSGLVVSGGGRSFPSLQCMP